MSDERPDIDGPAETDLARLAETLRPLEPSPAQAARLRVRVLGSAAMERARAGAPQSGLQWMLSDHLEWTPLYEGVELCVLHENTHTRAALYRMAPGAVLLPHAHTADEESLILDGDARVGGDVHLTAGSYEFMPAGSRHALIRSPGGCVVLVRGQRRYRPRFTPALLRHLLGRAVQRFRCGP